MKRRTLTIDIPEDGSVPYLQEYLEEFIRDSLDEQGFVLHNTTLERIADAAFRAIVLQCNEATLGE